MADINRPIILVAVTALLFFRHSAGIEIKDSSPLRTQGQGSPRCYSDEKSSTQSPQVKISNGIIQGKTVRSGNGKKVNAFLGIPFAQPPVGQLRFKRPVAYDACFDKPYDATILPKACPQDTGKVFENFTGEDPWLPNTEVSEDCLYLNIWVPPNSSELKRSVIFWIYGGAFYSGSSSLDLYNGGTLAVETNSIVVSTQYRLGPLGFLYLGTEDAPGNQGLLDQNMAMQWVHKNIEAFGGNPDEVTLMGESAGAASVSFHLLSPMSQNLFKRAVLLSGVATAPWAYASQEQALKNAHAFAEKAGCPQSSDPKRIFDCLSKMNHSTLTPIQFLIASHPFDFPMGPAIDNFFLTKTPQSYLGDGSLPKKDILMGNNLDEGSFFLPFQFMDLFSPFKASSLSIELLVSSLENYFPVFNKAQKAALLMAYKNQTNTKDKEENQKIVSDAVGDANFVCPCKEFANRWAATTGSSVYYYYFTHHTESDPWAKWMGVKHGDEIAYFFGVPLNTSASFTAEEQLLSKKMVTLLGNFVKTGIPAPRDWSPYSISSQVYANLNINVTGIASTLNGPRAKQCSFWNDLVPKMV